MLHPSIESDTVLQRKRTKFPKIFIKSFFGSKVVKYEV